MGPKCSDTLINVVIRKIHLLYQLFGIRTQVINDFVSDISIVKIIKVNMKSIMPVHQ